VLLRSNGSLRGAEPADFGMQTGRECFPVCVNGHWIPEMYFCDVFFPAD
jgi:hypothetical protein